MAIMSALNTLIELAIKDCEEAAKRLGIAIRSAEEMEKKLSMLLGYRDEYAARFQNSLTNGLSAMDYRNFQQFLDKLDTAIAGQEVIVLNAKRQIEEERKLWQECEKKRLSYDTLADRQEKEKQLQENRRDQKQTDEHAARSAQYKR
jgi:flagellar FliJ protein